MPWNNAAMLTDKDGNFIPQLWDPSQNKFIPWDGKVQQSGANVPLTVRSTLLNAVSLPPGTNTGWIAIDPEGARRVIVQVACDKSWSLASPRQGVVAVTEEGAHIFPNVSTVQGATGANNPAEIIFGFRVMHATNFLDALNRAYLPSRVQCLVRNEHASDIATLSVWVVRFYH